MILLIHKKAKNVERVLKGETEIKISNHLCTKAFWELAEKYPEEIIGWCERDFERHLDLNNWPGIFHHQLIMASYASTTDYLPPAIGYIDQLPFVKVKKEVLYGTWKMSSDVGGIYGKVLLRFKPLLKNIQDFDYLLNSVAKLGQQNSLFCYSAPQLIKKGIEVKNLQKKASQAEVFRFVYQHYNSIWSGILFWSLLKYEKKFPLLPLLTGIGKQKFFRKEINLSDIVVQTSKKIAKNEMDVIIPTMGRPQYLRDVLKDFAAQTHLPRKVIVVEQNPDLHSDSELDYLQTESWPFEIVHHFIHKTGACNARNTGAKNVTSHWVFFADDDIRFEEQFFEKVFIELNRLGCDAVNLNCIQPHEKVVFHKIKQWGAFGSGTSVVKSEFALKCEFSEVFEHGYGEDIDYGMQLRNQGCDIIYHPRLKITHLKAPVGGFRHKPVLPWEEENPQPKPSPTLMAFALKHYSKEQFKGFKTSLFLRFYKNQPIKNPFKYVKVMRQRWEKSERWAKDLFSKS